MRIQFSMDIPTAGLTTPGAPSSEPVLTAGPGAPTWYGATRIQMDDTRRQWTSVQARFYGRDPYFHRPVNAADYPPALVAEPVDLAGYELYGWGLYDTGTTANGQPVYKVPLATYLGWGSMAPGGLDTKFILTLQWTGAVWELSTTASYPYPTWTCATLLGDYQPDAGNTYGYTNTYTVRTGTSADWAYGPRAQQLEECRDLFVEWLILREDYGVCDVTGGQLVIGAGPFYANSIGVWPRSSAFVDGEHHYSSTVGSVSCWCADGSGVVHPPTEHAGRIVTRYALGMRAWMTGARIFSLGYSDNGFFGWNYDELPVASESTSYREPICGGYEEIAPGVSELPLAPGSTWPPSAADFHGTDGVPNPIGFRYIGDVGASGTVTLTVEDDGTDLLVNGSRVCASKDFAEWRLASLQVKSDTNAWTGDSDERDFYGYFPSVPHSSNTTAGSFEFADEIGQVWAQETWASDTRIGEVYTPGVLGYIRALPATFEHTDASASFAVTRSAGIAMALSVSTGADDGHWNDGDHPDNWLNLGIVGANSYSWRYFPPPLNACLTRVPSGALTMLYQQPEDRSVVYARTSRDIGAGFAEAVEYAVGTASTGAAHDLQLLATRGGILVAAWQEEHGVAPGEDCQRLRRGTEAAYTSASYAEWAAGHYRTHRCFVCRDGGKTWQEVSLPTYATRYGPATTYPDAQSGNASNALSWAAVTVYAPSYQRQRLLLMPPGHVGLYLIYGVDPDMWGATWAVGYVAVDPISGDVWSDFAAQAPAMVAAGADPFRFIGVTPSDQAGLHSRQQAVFDTSPSSIDRYATGYSRPDVAYGLEPAEAAPHIPYYTAPLVGTNWRYIPIHGLRGGAQNLTCLQDAKGCVWVMRHHAGGVTVERTDRWEDGDAGAPDRANGWLDEPRVFARTAAIEPLLHTPSAVQSPTGQVFIAAYVVGQQRPAVFKSSGAPWDLAEVTT